MLNRLPLWFGDYCMKDEAALSHFLNSNMSCTVVVCVPDFDVEHVELSFASICDGHRRLSEYSLLDVWGVQYFLTGKHIARLV